MYPLQEYFPIVEIPQFLLVVGIGIMALYLSNMVYDYGVPQYLSRKVGHGIGGVFYLLNILMFSTPWWPILASGGFVLLLGGARLLRPSTFRGVGGTARKHALAEVYFPLGGTISLLIGWVYFGNPMLAIVPILYMAWGDMVTGLIRSKVYGKEIKGNWGSVGMLATCLVVGGLFAPYWIAVCGAVVATLAERWTPMSKGLWDDNWSIIFTSLAVMITLMWFTGGL